MIVLDASVLIGHMDANDAHHERAESILLEARGEALIASPVTLAEVLVGPARAGRLSEAATALAVLKIRTVPLEPDTPIRLALLRAETSLKLPDCCVLLAAETANAAVATFDGRLARVAAGRGLEIRDTETAS